MIDMYERNGTERRGQLVGDKHLRTRGRCSVREWIRRSAREKGEGVEGDKGWRCVGYILLR